MALTVKETRAGSRPGSGYPISFPLNFGSPVVRPMAQRSLRTPRASEAVRERRLRRGSTSSGSFAGLTNKARSII